MLDIDLPNQQVKVRMTRKSLIGKSPQSPSACAIRV